MTQPPGDPHPPVPPPLPDTAGPTAPRSAAPPPLPSQAAPPPVPQSSPVPQPPISQSSTPDIEAVPRAPRASDRAMLHVTEQTRTYPCGSCGAALAFNPDQQNLACGSCGTTYPIIIDPQATLSRHDLQSTVQEIRALIPTGQEGNEHEVICQSCGGRTIFNGTLTATRCPYCATPIQRTDIQDSPERLAVDGILPLRVSEDHARTEISNWINSRWFAPSEFKKYRTLGSFTSVYMSYFTYDADTVTQYRGRRGDNYTVVVGSGEDRRTETRIRWRSVRGTVANRIRDLPENANTGFDAKRVRELEPWPMEQVTPYKPEFVAGHLSRTYDNDPMQVFTAAARPRIDSMIESTIRADIGGDHQQITSKQTNFSLLQFMYVLLPLWLLTVSFESRPFQVFVNGLTGEVQGQRPWSKVKIIAASVAVLIVVAVIAYFVWRS
ncbi:hypothetical protein [Gordonia hydrophobica]|uniref:Uncharacterized protein n=1 Tax=Gordonia hydrophobica TaxID=40516 RepID=A0ABZ2U6X7_9ACTN|nr:hypothetical protein [Gordonia hydrophobica]MBM7366114.1 putative RNA-binding Zn-ribbon protein involved in translation (DUF1610 family) [Gordonia hydrophobica]